MGRLVWGIVMLAGCGWVTAAEAFWLDAFVHRVETGRRENAQWPARYLCPDRAHVRAPFDIMVVNGWRRQNLLGPHHFTEDGATLTKAGELKVRWILTQTPPQFRQIFVERSLRPEENVKRLDAIQQYALEVVPSEEPVILETDLMSEGQPAALVDAIDTRYRESMPPPVLPAMNSLDADSQ